METSQIEVFYNEVVAELECDVCVEIMVPPISMCVTGHSFCHRCAKNLNKCPVCRGDKSSARNYALENIYNKIHFPCQNNVKGCTFVSKGANMQEHKQCCAHERKMCPLRSIANCNWRGEFKDVFGHCLANHPENTYNGSSQKLMWPRFRNGEILRPDFPGDAYCMLFQAYGQLFKCVWDANTKTGFMRWCVVYMGPKIDAKKYFFQINFKNTTSNSNQGDIMLRSTCQPQNVTIFQKDFRMLTHVDMLKRICGPNGLCYTLSIHKASDNSSECVLAQEYTSIVPETCLFYDVNDPVLEAYRSALHNAFHGDTLDLLFDEERHT